MSLFAFDLDPDLREPSNGSSWLLLDDAASFGDFTPRSAPLAAPAEEVPIAASQDTAPFALAEGDDEPLYADALDAVAGGTSLGAAPDPDGDAPPVDVAPQAPPGPWTIDAAQILKDRPDVLQAYYEAYHVSGAYKTPALWVKLVGGATANDYANYWYETHGRFEGYNQGSLTAELNISVEKILADRPDVMEAYHSSMRHGRHSQDWVKEVGGDTPEAYAKYWYKEYGRWEGYGQTERAADDTINIARLIVDRPDVVDAYYKAYYSVNTDHNSSAWSDRVGGETLQDYAKYWYANHGRKEGYTQNPNTPAAAAPEPSEPAPPVHDPSLDPWNHPALYPDWQPPYPGWTPPDTDFHASESARGEMTEAIASIGQALGAGDML